jgi:hypothetical protein
MVTAEPSDSLAGELRALLPDLRQIVGEGRPVTVCFEGTRPIIATATPDRLGPARLRAVTLSYQPGALDRHRADMGADLVASVAARAAPERGRSVRRPAWQARLTNV